MLPYNLLLQKTARDSLGIDLTNQVVIIDEAHSAPCQYPLQDERCVY